MKTTLLLAAIVLVLAMSPFPALGRPQALGAASEHHALQFSGRPDYVVVNQSPTINLGLDMTFEFWVRTTASYGGPNWHDAHWILDKDIQGMVKHDWAVVLRYGKVVFDNGNPGGGADQPLFGSTEVNDGTPHHVAITRDASTGKTTIYIDGSVDVEGYFSTADLSNTLPLYIGAEQRNLPKEVNSDPRAFVGELDELRLWNVVRSQQDIQAHMFVSLIGGEPGLVAYWRFNEGTGQVVIDATSNHNDGQLGSSGDPDGNDPLWLPYDLGGSLPDTGFRPDPDGYRFANWGSGVNEDFTYSNLVQMFGSDCVCKMADGGCKITPQARAWLKGVVKELKGGRCLGMSAASLRFSSGRDAHPGFNATYSLERGSLVQHTLWDGNTWAARASEHITYHAALQFTLPAAVDLHGALSATPSQVLGTLVSLMQVAANPPYLVLLKSQKGPGHAIVPYAVSEAGDGVFWVSVYDNNYPADAGRFVEIDIYQNTWSYAVGGGTTWSGDANSHTLGAVPVGKHDAQPVCTFVLAGQLLDGEPQGQVWLDGPGHLLITDATGQQIGFVGEQYVEDMAGAFGLVPVGGLDIPSEPIYFVPLTSTHTIVVSGETLTQTETVSVTRFGPGHAVLAENVPLEPAKIDLISVTADGSRFSYEASTVKQMDLSLVADLGTASYQLLIDGADIGAGQKAALFIAALDGRLALSHQHNGGGQYNVSVTTAGVDAEATFHHSDVTIEATDTHYFDYGSWDGAGPMILEIDHGSDGTIDEIVPLDNQARRICLPLVLRNH